MKCLKLLFGLIIATFAICFSSCSDDEDNKKIVYLKVASTLNVTDGETSLIIREIKDYNTAWIPYYYNIIGFNYEEGYEYF